MNLRKISYLLICLFFSNLIFAQKQVSDNDNFCYAKLKSPDKYDEITEEVLVRPAYTKTIIVPAEYTTITEKIVIQPASKRLIYFPAEYETVGESIIDKPASSKIITFPAKMEKRTVRILTKEESKRLEVVPATYELVTDSVLIKPATKYFKPIPAVFETITEQILTTPEAKKIYPVPAEYETVMEKIEIEPASVRISTIEPQYEIVEEKVEVQPAFNKWIRAKGDPNCLSADPNDCQIWCLVEVPAEYNVVKRRKNIGCDGSGIANSGCTQEIPIPAKYETRTRKILKTPSTTRTEVIPEEYSTVTKSVIKTPATVEEAIVPAVYQKFSRKMVKTPAIVREVVIPAEYQEITIEVEVAPAYTKEAIIPATYKTIQKKVLKKEATTKEEIIPAQYATISKRVLNSKEYLKYEEIPAEYTTITKKMLREKGDMQWRRIVCPKFKTENFNRQLQLALQKAGYPPGPIDNIFGPKTYAALVKYQKDNGMWYGQIDYNTVNSLGILLKPEAYNDRDGSMIAMPPESKSENNVAEEEILLGAKGGAAETPDTTSLIKKAVEPEKKEVIKDNTPDPDIADSKTSMSGEENQMIKEINLMRSDPQGYVKYVEDYILEVQKDPGLDDAYKNEEISTARELIAELNKLSPLTMLQPHEGLHKVGIKHGKDVQSQGMIGHRGNDGSMPWDRVRRDTELKDGNENLVAGGGSVRESFMILLVDSGIPGRGHRRTLLEPKWTHVGVNKIGEVGGIPNAWIQVFGKE